MKKKLLVASILTLSLALGVGVASIVSKKSVEQVNAESYEGNVTSIGLKQEVIDTHDDSLTEIRSFYSDLNSLDPSERKGTNLLKHLKPILQDGTFFTSYANTRKWLMITDRDWIQSPLENPTAKYTYPSDLATAPKVHVLYRIDNGEDTALTFAGVHSGDGDLLDKEHTWPKACGFKGNYSDSAPGTDLHHLMLADDGINQRGHSNYPYGDASTPTIKTGTKTTEISNTYGIGYKYKDTSGNNWFEPQDQDKGDIARAMFYMVARYNNLAGISMVESGGSLVSEANLGLINMSASNYSNETIESLSNVVANYGDLSTLLRWHRLDPVSDYEIHRNNLIDNNYQHNRNPFIDYPDWVDYIWGDSEGYAQPNVDTISQYGHSGMIISGNSSVKVGNTTSLSTEIEGISGTDTILWSSSNTSVVAVNSSGVVTGVSEGSATIKAITKDSSFYAEKTITVTTGGATHVAGVTLNKDSLSLTEGDSDTLTATVSPANADNKNITWSTSDADVATINNGIVDAVGEGTATITVTTEDGGYTDTCLVTVSAAVKPEGFVHTLSFATHASDNNTALTTANFLNDDNVASNDLVEEVTTADKCYKGTVGLKMGSGSARGLFTATVNSEADQGVKTITITSGKYGTDKGLLVFSINNGQTIISSEITPGVNFTHTFDDPVDISNFTIETTQKRAYLKSITFSAESEDPGADPTSVSLNKNATTLSVSLTEQLVAIVNPENALNKNVSWESSDEDVVTVENGLLTAVATGTATITVTTEVGGYTDTCSVTVKDAPVGKYGLVFSLRDNDSTTALTTANFLNADIDSNTMVSEITYTKNCYHGKSGIKIGKSGEAGIFTASVAAAARSNIKQILIDGEKYGSDNGSINLYVNGGTEAIATFAPAGDLNYVFDDALDISSFSLETTEKRAYVRSIIFITEDKYAVNTFVTTYMHMTDYDPELTGEGSGLCLGEAGYYMTAKTALTSMSDEQILVFRTDADYTNARLRYEAWADAYGDKTPYSTTVNTSNTITIKKSSDFVLYIVLFSSILSTMSLLLVLKLKKKEQ